MVKPPRYRTHRGAITDLAEAIAHLSEEAPEQALRLVALYRAARQRIRRNPLAHGTMYEDYRRAVLVPFRYMVVYVTDGESIDVLAVLDARRHPDRLRSQLSARTFDEESRP